MSAEAWAVVAIAVVGWIGFSVNAWYRREQKLEKLSNDVRNIGMKVSDLQKDGIRRMARVDARMAMDRMIDIACTSELDLRVRKCELFKEDLEQ